MKNTFLTTIANLDKAGKSVIRAGIVIIFLWIGALKFVPYEADGIVPFVANSPFMSALYNNPQEYKDHVNKEGELIPENRQWNIDNNTYGFANELGILLIGLSVLVGIHRWAPLESMFGSILIFILTLGTLSFLITTPESWVPHLTDQQYGFPFLSGRGRLVLKDVVIMGASIITMSESAALYLKNKKAKLITARS
ncbi:DUF417 family protein [Flavobacterium sp. CLA17]|uniref:DUF417 family protein n=1 Tax=Flavobacterium sp. CLA17 TaxID=2724135 RepID=UPI0014912F7C|nr:DUF417 family protein [Flavobacterium sp. CLA17]QSB25261.1 YkgB family protein [Flavobacterium sp. CLA17]